MPVIKVEDIAHVRFAAPDLAVMRAFLVDFGLSPFGAGGRLYGRGSDGRPFLHVTEPGEARFLAVGLRAETLEDLERLAAHESVPVEHLDEPGGGKVVRLVDPDGYGVEVVAGQNCQPSASPPTDPPQKQTMQALLAVQWGSPHPMFAGRMPPPAGLLAFVIALQLRIRRLFRRKIEGTSA